jgi:hypothetical protein
LKSDLEGVYGMGSSGKLLSCAFLPDVLCSYRKDAKFGVMARCFKCPHYVRFIREMDQEDEEIDKEVEDAFANPEKYLRGQDDDRR